MRILYDLQIERGSDQLYFNSLQPESFHGGGRFSCFFTVRMENPLLAAKLSSWLPRERSGGEMKLCHVLLPENVNCPSLKIDIVKVKRYGLFF